MRSTTPVNAGGYLTPSTHQFEFCMHICKTGGILTRAKGPKAMVQLDFHPRGRHFRQIPGPGPVPDRILRALRLPTIDHRSLTAA
jgi:hypothetical protein